MMKKKLLLLCMALGVLFVFAAHSLAAYSEIRTTDSSRQLPLKGRYESSPGFRSGITPIIAEQQDTAIFVRFQRTVGVVQVTITDEYGETVFIETVNAVMQPSLTISLMELPSGSYVITFSNHNLEMSGEFEI
jgi:hypothetical protein